MKKLLNYIPVLGVAMAFAACESDLDGTTYNAETAQPAVLSTPATTNIVLESRNSENVALTLEWEKADFGYSAISTTNIDFDLAGNNFANARQLAAVTTATTQDITVNDLNSAVINLLNDHGIEEDYSARDYEIRLSSSISQAADTLYSNVITLNITPYSMDIQYPEMFVIGDYCGWSGENAQTQNLFSFSEDEVNYEGLIDFGDKAANGFKITDVAPNSDWSNCEFNCGVAETPAAEAASLILSGSGDIKCYSKRFYRFQFCKSDLKLTMNLSFDALYLVGSAANLTWDTSKPENQMNFDPEKQRFYIDFALEEGDEIKVLTDTQIWFGGTADGGLNTQDNIKVPASGNYRVYVNLNNSENMTYELNADDYGK